jgi:proteasome lid subunit RPN8/RPN11
MTLRLDPETWEAIFAECRRCHPEEACGIVVGTPSAPAWVRFDNQANRLHQADPQAWPRDARTSFSMHALQLQRRIDEAEAGGGRLWAVVHSHPQHPSYFSETDRRAAAPFGAPTFPDAVQVVVSVYDGEVREVRGFVWDGADWPEVALGGLPPLPGRPPGARILGDV